MKGLNATSCGAFTGAGCPANHDCTLDPPPGREAADVLFWCQPKRGGSPFAALKNEDAVEIYHRKSESPVTGAVTNLCSTVQTKLSSFVKCSQQAGTAKLELDFGSYFKIHFDFSMCDAHARQNGMSVKVHLQIKEGPPILIFKTGTDYKAALPLPNMDFPGVGLTGVTLNIESSGGLKDFRFKVYFEQCVNILQKKCVSQLSHLELFNSQWVGNLLWLLDDVATECEDAKCLFPKIPHSNTGADQCSSKIPTDHDASCAFTCENKYASNSNIGEFTCTDGSFVPEVPPTLKCEPIKS